MVRKSIDNKSSDLTKIKEGDDGYLRMLYEQNREVFLKWVNQHYSCSETEAKDIYQQAFSILYFNVKDGKITSITSSIRTYLFGIAKNLLRKKNQETSKLTSLDNEINTLTDNLDYYQIGEKNDKAKLINTLLEKLGDPCKSILNMFYFKKFAMEAIAERMGYKNEQSMKKKKSLCLKQLREILLDSNKKHLLL
ncbi:RNA polymerase sigma factor [Chondrinema litorale]|uniref:RNA polymerase sigma factor n=1 Tax=Chondrinema litorale TaxID=2994555 RepID=UPI002543857C|nr:sigma-70 family RNA polymerase sigma factor [Chondrinema litorale]UZR99115.1 sigma-70 family RNA polymerase sigma factor [Chondrinema litorale]